MTVFRPVIKHSAFTPFPSQNDPFFTSMHTHLNSHTHHCQTYAKRKVNTSLNLVPYMNGLFLHILLLAVLSLVFFFFKKKRKKKKKGRREMEEKPMK